MAWYDFDLCGALAEAGLEVTLYTCDETLAPDEGCRFAVERPFVGIYGGKSKLARGIRYLSGLLKTLRQARRERAQIFHLHFFQASALEWITVAAVKAAGFRVVVTAHDVEGLSGEGSRLLASWIYRAVDAIVAHSEVARRELMASLKIPGSRIALIRFGNFVQNIVDRITKSEARAKLGIAQTGPVVLFFGQIKRVKGLDILLRALPAVIGIHPDLRILIAGRPWRTGFSEYAEIIETLALANHLTMHTSYVPDELVPYYFRAADVVVLPYRKIYQSAVLMLSLSYGRPVLVSDIEGMTEVVEDGVSAFVFKDGDADGLGRRLSDALADPIAAKRIGESGRRMVEERFGWTRIAEEMAHLYRAHGGRT